MRSSFFRLTDTLLIVQTSAYDGMDGQGHGAAGPGMRGRGMMRGTAPLRGSARGRGAGQSTMSSIDFAKLTLAAPVAVPLRAAAMPPNAPRGPKAGRFRDKDRVDTSGAGALDYGGDSRGSEGSFSRGRSPRSAGSRSPSRSRSRSRSPANGQDRSRSNYAAREYNNDDDVQQRSRENSHDRYKSRSDKRDDRYGDDRYGDDRYGGSDDRDRRSSSRREGSRRDRERSEPERREKRKRDDGSLATGLGPGGWEEEDPAEETRSAR